MKKKKTPESLEDLFTGENSATLIDLEKMVKNFRNLGLTDQAKIPLSYLVSALYKNVPENLSRNMKEIYTQGYIQGLEDAKKEIEKKGDSNETDKKA